ncbi:PTS mannose/fructose/sorbose/N-acetylgalactosamine transporter subunit IIC [Geosporobacter ferrireducens]|uniref:PTS mannose/fructose/sorbose/N-acetylgalactosamine transporter subunit IIC n=1 Tax=Geosporobacter ferrireducens TaxID=1424294 RepID=UPI0009F30018|nr:PTS sugar transporter subunit IIC [Geosporobacter ferrireducens]MTI54293.1 PTS sugar transporter subunit IIC [Geosporobacter ferrireducens]
MTIQLVFIALLTYLGAIGAPWFFGTTGGFYTLGRPLIASALVGIILGDVKLALEVGVLIQAMYIGIITPGAVMPFDVNYIGYLTTALVVLSKMDPQLAPTLAIPVGLLGVLLWNVVWIVNVYFVHKADKYAEAGNMKGVKMMNLLPQVVNFALRFIPAFVILYLGKDFLQNFISSIPPFVNHYLQVVGGMLPALGIGLLLNMIIKEKIYFGIFLIGFLAVVYLQLPIIPIALFGTVLALFWFKFTAESEVS